MRVRRRRRARVAGGQVPVRGRAARHRRRARRRSRRPAADRRRRRGASVDHVLGMLRVELGRPPVHEGGLHVPVGRRLPAVRGARRRRPARSRPTTRSRCRTPTTSSCSRRHGRGPRSTCARRPTTSCSTAGSSARAASGSTGPTCSSGSSRCSASPTRRRRRASASCSTPFRYGAPPHAGFAFGIDRLVAILAGEDNIREVIAFPKTQSGADPLTGAPAAIDPTQLRELGLSVLPREEVGAPRNLGRRSAPPQSRSAGRGRLRLGRGDRVGSGWPTPTFTTRGQGSAKLASVSPVTLMLAEPAGLAGGAVGGFHRSAGVGAGGPPPIAKFPAPSTGALKLPPSPLSDTVTVTPAGMFDHPARHRVPRGWRWSHRGLRCGRRRRSGQRHPRPGRR